jgi:hypothetical protein
MDRPVFRSYILSVSYPLCTHSPYAILYRFVICDRDLLVEKLETFKQIPSLSTHVHLTIN